MRALVLQHIACEPPGVYEDVLRERAAAIHRVEVDAGEELPDWRDFDLIVAMGGPMSVNDDLEWLLAEKRFVAEAVRNGVAFFGACLGAQLLASSLGARVYAGPAPEVGMLAVTLSEDALSDPVFAGLEAQLTTLQWHGDTFDLPAGAVALASSAAYPNQAFRWGSRAYAIQFHLEVSSAMACEWAEVPAYAQALEDTLGPGAFDSLLRDFEPAAAALNANGRRLFSQWLDHAVVASGAASIALP
jgi:GMP synthase (glutamine-hydrolysing)